MKENFETKRNYINTFVLVTFLTILATLSNEAKGQGRVVPVKNTDLKEILKKPELPAEMREKYKGLAPKEAFERKAIEEGPIEDRIERLKEFIRGEERNLKYDKTDKTITEQELKDQEERIKELKALLQKLEEELNKNRPIS